MDKVGLQKLSDGEIALISELADNLFDSLVKDDEGVKKLTAKQAFILGMLHGREHALGELGIFDNEDEDDSAVYDFIEKYGINNKKN